MWEPTMSASTLVGRSKSSLSKLTNPSTCYVDGVRRGTRRRPQDRLLQGSHGQTTITNLSSSLNLPRSKACLGYFPTTTPRSKEAPTGYSGKTQRSQISGDFIRDTQRLDEVILGSSTSARPTNTDAKPNIRETNPHMVMNQPPFGG